MSKTSDLESLAKSYLDLWQDQVAAMTADPANAEAMARLFEAMAAGLPGLGGPTQGPVEHSDEQTGDKAAPSTVSGTGGATGTPPVGAASGDRDAGLSELAGRVGALEERLERLERKLERAGGGARGKPKGRKS